MSKCHPFFRMIEAHGLSCGFSSRKITPAYHNRWLGRDACFLDLSLQDTTLRSADVARWFRFVEKKRGGRRTGSNWIGSLGEAIFFASLFLLGTLLLSVLLGTQFVRPDPERYAFGVGGWLLVLVTASSIVLGGGGLIWAVLGIGTSLERRHALARHAVESDIVRSAVPRSRDYPALPAFDGLIDSPGIKLAYRLPSSQTPAWQLLAVTVFTMLWNLVICLLTVSVASAHVAGRHEWLVTALLVPCWGVSYWSVRTFLQLLIHNSGMATTTVEISDLPLSPGREYQVAVAQHGHATIRSLELALVCEEEATFTQGTDVRREIREVFRQSLWTRENFDLTPDSPFFQGSSLNIPHSAMHSFQSAHNAVRWKLVVRGEAASWPVFQRDFPLVVYPGETTMQLKVAAQAARIAIVSPSIAEALAEVRA